MAIAIHPKFPSVSGNARDYAFLQAENARDAEIDKRLRTIARSKTFIDWDRRKPLVQELDPQARIAVFEATTVGEGASARNSGRKAVLPAKSESAMACSRRPRR